MADRSDVVRRLAEILWPSAPDAERPVVHRHSKSALDEIPHYAVTGWYGLPNPQRLEYVTKSQAFTAARAMKQRGYQNVQVWEHGRVIYGWDK
jgi:hypothetical protein